MKKILVPCDFSSPSKEAFRFAVQLADRTGAEVYVLRVTELPVIYEPGLGVPEYGFDRSLAQELEDDAKHKLDDLEKICGVSGANVHLLSESGPVNSTIREVSREQKMDLIIMSTHHHDSWFNSMIGTHTRKMVRSSRVPVLALKKFIPVDSIRSIVFPTLLTTERNEVVQRVTALQELFDATLHILFVNNPDDFHRDKDIRKCMQSFVDKHSLKRFTLNVYNDETVEKGIVNFTAEINADLVAMGHRGSVPLFGNNVAEEVLEATDALVWSCVVP